jgi:hypothetical protein
VIVEKVRLQEIRDIAAYERVREAMRREVIALKARRRVALGPRLSLLFENRQTVLFQIQEMTRTERIVEEARIREELHAYNALVPEAGQLSATLFIEIPDLHRLSQDEVRREVNRFQGLDRGAVRLRLGEELSLPAVFEAGHSKEEKMAAVQYLRFVVPEEARRALRDPYTPARLVVDHPRYQAEAEVGAELRQELLADLGAPAPAAATAGP